MTKFQFEKVLKIYKKYKKYQKRNVPAWSANIVQGYRDSSYNNFRL